MIAIGIILFLMISVIILMIYRIIFNFRLNKISTQLDERGFVFRKKFHVYQNRELIKENKLLLGSNIIVTLCLGLLFFQHVAILKEQTELINEFSEVQELAQKTSDQQISIIKQVGYQEYPLSGLALDKLEWDKNDSESVKKLQLELADKLTPYFDYTTPLISYVPDSKELLIGINPKNQDKEVQQVEKNIKSLLFDLKYTPLLTVEIKTKMDGTVTNTIYERSNIEEELKLEKK